MSELLKSTKFKVIAGICVVLILGFVALIIFTAEEPAPELPVGINITWWNLHNNPVYQEVANDFSALYGGGVNINIVNMNYGGGVDYHRRLIMAFAKGQAPDIFTLRNETIPAWRNEGFIAPITNLTDFTNGQQLTSTQLMEDYRENFVPIVLKETVFRNEIYAVTNYVDNLQLFYNREILDQAGITTRPRSWAELERQIQILNRRNERGDFVQSAIALGTGLNKRDGGVVRDTNLANFYEIVPALIFQSGNPIYDSISQNAVFGGGRNIDDVNTRNITTKNFEQTIKDNDPSYNALRYFTSFVDRNSNNHSWNIQTERTSKEAFLRGELAYSLNYKGFEKEILEGSSRLRYGITELPQIDQDSKKTYGRFFADVMNVQVARMGQDAQLTDPQAYYKYIFTKQFLYYLTQPSVQAKILGRTRMPAARRDVIADQQQGERNLVIFANGSLYADTYYKPDPRRVRRMWGNLLYRTHYENMPLKQSMAQAIQEYNLLIQAGPVIDY